MNNPGFPYYGSRTGGTSFSYYNLSSPVNANIDNGVVPYLYTLASQYTLFDNFFRSANGASDIAYLAQFAGRLPAWGADGYTCAAASDPTYGTAATAYPMVHTYTCAHTHTIAAVVARSLSLDHYSLSVSVCSPFDRFLVSTALMGLPLPLRSRAATC